MNPVTQELLHRAEQRARDEHLSYRGAVTPKEAWILLQKEPKARLLDVRSREEWALVGRIPGAIEVEMKRFPAWIDNEEFLPQLRERLAPDDLVLVICRSGARSHKAAELLASEGFSNSFNVIEGFEGARDEENRRTVNGWKNAGLPYSV